MFAQPSCFHFRSYTADISKEREREKEVSRLHVLLSLSLIHIFFTFSAGRHENCSSFAVFHPLFVFGTAPCLDRCCIHTYNRKSCSTLETINNVLRQMTQWTLRTLRTSFVSEETLALTGKIAIFFRLWEKIIAWRPDNFSRAKLESIFCRSATSNNWKTIFFLGSARRYTCFSAANKISHNSRAKSDYVCKLPFESGSSFLFRGNKKLRSKKNAQIHELVMLKSSFSLGSLDFLHGLMKYWVHKSWVHKIKLLFLLST